MGCLCSHNLPPSRILEGIFTAIICAAVNTPSKFQTASYSKTHPFNTTSSRPNLRKASVQSSCRQLEPALRRALALITVADTRMHSHPKNIPTSLTQTLVC